MDHLISSIIGTGCAEIITLPICTIKTVYQNSDEKKITTIIKQIYNRSGYIGFFQASLPAISSQILSTSTKYYFYNVIKEKRGTDSKDIMSNSINGALGGILGSLFSHPFDVCKNYIQRNEKFNIKINIKTLYQGYSASILKNIVLHSSLFPIYDYYKIKFDDNQILASICTTITCSLIVQPVDYYKTVLMTGNNFTDFRNPYRGFSLLLSRSIPHFMLTMCVTEYIKKMIN